MQYSLYNNNVLKNTKRSEQTKIGVNGQPHLGLNTINTKTLLFKQEKSYSWNLCNINIHSHKCKYSCGIFVCDKEFTKLFLIYINIHIYIYLEAQKCYPYQFPSVVYVCCVCSQCLCSANPITPSAHHFVPNLYEELGGKRCYYILLLSQEPIRTLIALTVYMLSCSLEELVQ